MELNKKTYLLLAITWTLIITFLSLATLGTIGNTIKIPYKDKMVHFVFYFLFVILWYFYKNRNAFNKKNAFSIVVLAIGYGILMELLQGILTTTRVADITDVFANSLGAILAIVVLKMYYRNKKRL